MHLSQHLASDAIVEYRVLPSRDALEVRVTVAAGVLGETGQISIGRALSDERARKSHVDGAWLLSFTLVNTDFGALM